MAILVPGGIIDHMGWHPFSEDYNPNFKVYTIEWRCLYKGLLYSYQASMNSRQLEEDGMTPADLEDIVIRTVNQMYFRGELFKVL